MKIQNNFETTFPKFENTKKTSDEIKKSVQKLNPDSAQENECIEVKIDEDIQDGDGPGEPDTRSDKEKFDSAKNCIETALNSYAAFQEQLWNDFPELYNTTKDFDGEYITCYEGNGSTLSPVIKYEEGLNFSEFYSEDYPVISKIAAGIEKPWKNVETKDAAAELLLEIINEATNDNDLYKSITSGSSINQGEYAAIQAVLDGLSAKDNKEINELVDMCREKLQNADKKTVSVEEILNNYSSISSDSSKKIIDKVSSIESYSQGMEKLQTKYEELKSELQDKPLMEDDAKRLYDIYSQYEWSCRLMLEAGGLEDDTTFSIGSIPKRNTGIIPLKSELEAYLYGGDTDAAGEDTVDEQINSKHSRLLKRRHLQ